MSNIFQSAIVRLILALLSAVLACVVISSDFTESSAQGAHIGLNQQRVRYERAGEHSTPSVGVNVEHDFLDDDESLISKAMGTSVMIMTMSLWKTTPIRRNAVTRNTMRRTVTVRRVTQKSCC